MSLRKVLVANRGEIACRIIKTVRSMGLSSVAVYSEADAKTPHVHMADESVCIGPSPVGQSYLSVENILTAVRETRAQAIHPGYGFLSENAEFAEAVEAAGLIFIGAPPAAIRAMGNKAEAKRLMIEAGVPCVPGYQETDQTDNALVSAAGDIGYPIMVKAAAGGGGRGMRLVNSKDDLPEAIRLARSEAQNAFGSGELILEKAIERPRHVEVQIMADAHGNCIHLGERDCSIQRRHQKVFEEAPCPVMTPELREEMTSAAINAAKAVDYRGAGTIEFLLSENGEFYFLEMNTRLQVEHPVTEMITGLDLVELQIRVAQGETLPIKQEDVRLQGHAIEARLYAESPSDNFMPTTGKIERWQPPTGDGVRCDDGVSSGQDVTPFYDPMLAKIIAHGPDRQTAIRKLCKAVGETVLQGVKSNREFLADVLQTSAFTEAAPTTAFLNENFPEGFESAEATYKDYAIAAVLMNRLDHKAAMELAGLVSDELGGWSSAEPLPRPVNLIADENQQTFAITEWPDRYCVESGSQDEKFAVYVEIEQLGAANGIFRVDGKSHTFSYSIGDSGALYLSIGSRDLRFTMPSVDGSSGHGEFGGQIDAPMPGTIVSIAVKIGDLVEAGQVLGIIEAMKMQHPIKAARSGIIVRVHAEEGQQILSGAPMFELETEE